MKMKNLFFKRIILLIIFCINFDSWSVQEDDADTTSMQDTEERDVVDDLLLDGLNQDNNVGLYTLWIEKRWLRGASCAYNLLVRSY